VRPACLFPQDAAESLPVAAALAEPLLPSDETFDAGDLACGELVLELRTRLAVLPAHTVLRVSARDPAAPVDLPAWCGLTGHRLLAARHPLYWIERKESPPS
jgi:tRNA 2-thiouridine synthesizing protein A